MEKDSFILIACEESGTVTEEFVKLGYQNVFSADIIPTSGKYPDKHILGDVIPLLDGNCSFNTEDGCEHVLLGKWDMIIAFPPCTDLCVSGARHFEKKRADGRQKNSIEFFMKFVNADCDKIAIENPIGIISGNYIGKHFPELQERYNFPVKHSQVIQPYQFGDPVKKGTCLWLKNLPTLIHTKNVENEVDYYISPKGKKMSAFHAKQIIVDGKKHGYDSSEFKKHRSKTFLGIAKAMAEQWTKGEN